MNALQAMQDSPSQQRHLTLTLSTDARQGRLSVQDTGPGLDNLVLTHIFEPFFTTRQDGLGLGLSLCETFANAMGGSLTAFNHPPHGAEFCLSLRLPG